jgi:hypothetical protein
MSKRLWLTAILAGVLMAAPVALMIVNLGHGVSNHRVFDDMTWGMIFLGLGMVALGGLIEAPRQLRGVVAAKG